jgi:hypothetical protein
VCSAQVEWTLAAAAAAGSAADKAWYSIIVPDRLGLAAVRHKWRQNLSDVEVFVRLSQTTSPKQVCVLNFANCRSI